MVLFAADRDRHAAGRRSARSTSPPACCSTALGLVLRVFAVALPGVHRLRHHRPDRPGRRAGAERQGPGPVRDRRAGRVPADAAARPGVADAHPGPPGPRHRRRPQPGGPGCGCSPRPAFALLVGALRRGGRLAVAMDARGFDSGVPRTFARRQRFTAPDARWWPARPRWPPPPWPPRSRWACSARSSPDATPCRRPRRGLFYAGSDVPTRSAVEVGRGAERDAALQHHSRRAAAPPPSEVKEIAEVTLGRLAGLDLDGLILYDIDDESDRNATSGRSPTCRPSTRPSSTPSTWAPGTARR